MGRWSTRSGQHPPPRSRAAQSLSQLEALPRGAVGLGLWFRSAESSAATRKIRPRNRGRSSGRRRRCRTALLSSRAGRGGQSAGGRGVRDYGAQVVEIGEGDARRDADVIQRPLRGGREPSAVAEGLLRRGRTGQQGLEGRAERCGGVDSALHREDVVALGPEPGVREEHLNRAGGPGSPSVSGYPVIEFERIDDCETDGVRAAHHDHVGDTEIGQCRGGYRRDGGSAGEQNRRVVERGERCGGKRIGEVLPRCEDRHGGPSASAATVTGGMNVRPVSRIGAS